MCYRLLSGAVTGENGRRCVTYGVGCDSIEVENVTTDRRALLKLIELMNEIKLEPVHLLNVLEDFLVECFKGCR